MRTCYSALHYGNHMVYRRRIPDHEDTFESYVHALEKIKMVVILELNSFMYNN